MTCNRSPHIQVRVPVKKPFEDKHDPRPEWLEKDFLEYLKKWKNYCCENRNLRAFFINETYQALLLTTRSTIACIRYLLEERNFYYVLTRCPSTDNVEMLLGFFRAMAGDNNKSDVLSVIFAWEKIVQTSIALFSIEYNLGLDKEKSSSSLLIAKTTEGNNNKLSRTKILLHDLGPDYLECLHNLHRLAGIRNPKKRLQSIAGKVKDIF